MNFRGTMRQLVKSSIAQRVMPGITPLCRFICLRFDDYHPANDLTTWKRTLSAYDDRDLRGLIAVCPNFGNQPLRKQDVKFLHRLRSNGWEIAQHGYTHDNLAGGDRPSEFQGVDFDEQYHRIGAGRQILEDLGFSPRTFVPPWHRFDDATLRALAAHDFDCINEGRCFYPRRKHGITLVPTHPPGLHSDTICVGVITLVGHPHLDDNPMRNAHRVAGFENRIRTPSEICDWWIRKWSGRGT